MIDSRDGFALNLGNDSRPRDQANLEVNHHGEASTRSNGKATVGIGVVVYA